MELQELAGLVERPDVHRRIVGDYAGPYSLGVTHSPKGPAFVLKVRDARGFPNWVTIEGQDIPVIVQGGFLPPRPL